MINTDTYNDKYSHDIDYTADPFDVYVRKRSSYDKVAVWLPAKIGWSMGMLRNIEEAKLLAEMLNLAIVEAERLDREYPTGSEVS